MPQYKNLQQIILIDLNRHSLNRMLSIQGNLELGSVISSSELEFLSKMIMKINICQQESEHDADCITIFTNVAHLLSQVVSLALTNEQKESIAISNV